MNNHDLKKLLLKVEKPTRYMGGELNSIVKNDAEYKFALCFPDVYEIGMSHLGSRILYNILNKREDTLCERVFTPWSDMENLLRENNLPLFSLESKRPLCDFDIIGFSLLYELSYTNVLTMLDLSGIPFYANERTENYPLIICGGPCTCNPEPIAPFMDAVVIGDGEEVTPRIMDVYAECKKKGLRKHDMLLEMANIEGIYIPCFYEAEYKDNRFVALNRISDRVPERPMRSVVKDLEHAEYVGKLLVPYMSIVHDRIALEAFRGCTRGCRFCQAGFIYRPVRERSVDTLLKYADELVDCTGYDEISLFSLSTGDYSEIHTLVKNIVDRYSKQNVSIALPSLRIDSSLKDDLEKIQSVRKAGLTLAPEAGTQRLRDVINKGVTEDDLIRSVRDAFESGWTSVKLYFMLGLPTETDEDLLGIVDLAKKVVAEYYSVPKDVRGKGLRVTVSVSTFVPKPFTPFQWEPQLALDEIRGRQKLLRDAFKGLRSIDFQYHDSETRLLEASFARGDRRLADVIVRAYKLGAKLDSWDEFFKFDVYRQAFAEDGLSMEMYASRNRNVEEKLPWDHIDMLVTKEYLMKEREKALMEITTKDCRKGCNGCFGNKYADYCKVY